MLMNNSGAFTELDFVRSRAGAKGSIDLQLTIEDHSSVIVAIRFGFFEEGSILLEYKA